MGECLIVRRGGESYKLPVLDASYPKDVSKTIVAGDNTSVSFDVIVSEAGNPAFYTYQWYDNGVAVQGATNSSYVKTNINDSMSCNVYCVVTNKAGSVTSRVASLNIGKYYTPTLDGRYPLNNAVALRNSVVCQVRIDTDGNPSNYTYQWYKNNVAINGAINSSYTFTPTELGDIEIYCNVTNTAGTVKSRTASITVIPVYLCVGGDTCDAITGGWQMAEGIGTAVEINASGINFTRFHVENDNLSWAYAITKKKIDLTNFNTISFDYKMDSGGYGTEFGVTMTTPGTGELIAKANVITSTDWKSLTLDISTLTGEAYIVARAKKNGAIYNNIRMS